MRVSGNHTVNCYGSGIFFFLTFILIAVTHGVKAEDCAPGLRTPGRTWPKGDIFLEYGQPLNIYCMLHENQTDPNFQHKNASNLVFYRDNTLIESEYITIVNETTIMMHIDQPFPAATFYYCKLRFNNSDGMQYQPAVCLNKVTIGFKPQKPRNFSCVSYNWEKLVCSWEPIPNNIPTRFSLHFSLPGRASRRASFLCSDVPKRAQASDLSPNTCLWDKSTDPMYRQVYEYYHFILIAENVLGKDSFIYKFHHWAHVIPSKPFNLAVINKTTSSALLHWAVPYPMQTFPPGLFSRVSYRIQRDRDEPWQTIDIKDRLHEGELYFNITGLEFANATYEVRVFLKSAKAIGDDRWSQSSNITFKTDPAPRNEQIPSGNLPYCTYTFETAQESHSKSPSSAHTPSLRPASALPNETVLTRIERRLSDLDEFIKKIEQHNEAVDRKLADIESKIDALSE